MVVEKVSSGSKVIDELLEGGYERGIVTTIYGPSGSGKTNCCLIAAVKVALSGEKVIIIDSEGGIAVERIKQLTPNWKEVLENILFIQPLTFQEQQLAFEKLKELQTEKVGLIVVDSISMLYRLELGKAEAIFETNSALGRQIATAVEIARRNKIPIIMTNQVYADFKKEESVKMVGGDLLKYGSKCLIELKKVDKEFGEISCYVALLRKHRYLEERKSKEFKIVNEGMVFSNLN